MLATNYLSPATYVWWGRVYHVKKQSTWVNIVVVSCVNVGLCVCWGDSRCSGADSSALCILKPPSPPAAKIELGGGGAGGGGGGKGGAGRRGKEGAT